MKLVTFVVNGSERLGIWSEPRGILDLAAAAQSLLGRGLPADMVSFIAAGPEALTDKNYQWRYQYQAIKRFTAKR